MVNEEERGRELLRLLVSGEKEIAAGKGYSLDSVLQDADSILANESSREPRTPS